MSSTAPAVEAPVGTVSGHSRRLDGAAAVSVAGRVERRIQRQVNRGESLITAVHLTVIAIVTVLFALGGYQGIASHAALQPVPFIMTLFLLWSLLRLLLNLRGALSPIMIGLSVVVETACLHALIWVQPLQYGDAAAAAFVKTDTLVFFFLFVATRGLGLQIWPVLLSAGLNILGYLLLVGNAALNDPSFTVTLDLREGLTTGALYLPGMAEILVGLILQTGVILVILLRHRATTILAAEQERAAEDLARFMAPDIASKVMRAEVTPQASEGVLVHGTVAFVDLRGFTKLTATLTPDQVLSVLSEYQAMIVPIIEKHHGTIDKFMGDGILATFGVASRSQSYALDAIQAAIAMAQAARRWRAERKARGEPALKIGCGMATGEVIFGTIGHNQRLEFTVIGDSVNRAAKIEKATKAFGATVLACEQTIETARRQGLALAIAPQSVTIDGVGTPQLLYPISWD